MSMNKQIFKAVGVTESDYKAWCKENKKVAYKAETKKEFFSRIQEGRLVKDSKGHLIKKYKRNK